MFPRTGVKLGLSIKGRTCTENVRERGAEEDIWFYAGDSNRRLENIQEVLISP